MPKHTRRQRAPIGSKALMALCLSLNLLVFRSPGTAQAAPVATARVPWTTSRLVGSPDPPAPYQAARIYPKLTFKAPVDLTRAPGSDRLYVAEQAGQIYSFRGNAKEADLVMDLTNAIPGVTALYGITFHPGFATNRAVYVCYVLKDGQPDGTRVSHFTLSTNDPPRIDPSSERVIIMWLAGGHNGGCLKFGPDGCLYISTGDGGGPNPPDPLGTGQDNRDLLSCILRIDVDHQENGKEYRIPPDNPFVGQAQARPEIWAYGLRNPWRMSFDERTGDLWVADVGWELWEMVYQVRRGGNYGWSIMEGPQPVRRDVQPGPTSILPPLKAHPHSEAASITGGCVYRGHKLPELAGAYIYGDWVTGKIWALRTRDGRSAEVSELVDTTLQVVCFALDNADELIVLDYAGGLYRLEPNTTPSDPRAFPRRLSETGLYASTQGHQLAPGVIPFEVNAEMWADGAKATRFVALPGTNGIQTATSTTWMNDAKQWRFPTNAVLGRTFSLELECGHPESARRLETQLLHFDGLDWRAYSYRWNESQTDASLVDANGDELSLEVQDATMPSGRREQSWRFFSRTECLRCHNPWVNFTLAFTAPQLNRGVSLAQAAGQSAPITNQLRFFSSLGLFDVPLDERVRPRFTDPYQTAADLNERARSWLQVNCAHCHREGAGGSVVSHFDYETRLGEMKAIGRRPSQGNLGLTNAHVITPGAPSSSVLFYRVATSGQGHMPLLGSRQADPSGLKLLQDWIRQLPPELSEDKNTPAAALGQPDLTKVADEVLARVFSGAETGAELDHLMGSASGALALLSSVNARLPNGPCPQVILQKAANHTLFQAQDLFERYLPPEKRVQKLGPSFKPEKILSLQGDAQRGRAIFFREGVQCAQCHRVGDQGTDFGPDLTQIGRKYARAGLLEQILEPSKLIDPAFTPYQLETKDQVSHTGFVVERTSAHVILKELNTGRIRIPMADIDQLQPQKLSLMPEGLLQGLTAQEAADLLEFLSSAR